MKGGYSQEFKDEMCYFTLVLFFIFIVYEQEQQKKGQTQLSVSSAALGQPLHHCSSLFAVLAKLQHCTKRTQPTLLRSGC